MMPACHFCGAAAALGVRRGGGGGGSQTMMTTAVGWRPTLLRCIWAWAPAGPAAGSKWRCGCRIARSSCCPRSSSSGRTGCPSLCRPSRRFASSPTGALQPKRRWEAQDQRCKAPRAVLLAGCWGLVLLVSECSPRRAPLSFPPPGSSQVDPSGDDYIHIRAYRTRYSLFVDVRYQVNTNYTLLQRKSILQITGDQAVPPTAVYQVRCVPSLQGSRAAGRGRASGLHAGTMEHACHAVLRSPARQLPQAAVALPRTLCCRTR